MINKLKTSFLAPYIGFSFILKNLNLVKYFIFPIIISFFLYILTIISLIYNFKFLLNKFLNVFNFISFDFFYKNFIFIFFKYLLFFFIIIAVLYIFILSFTFFLNLISAPFNEIVSKKILLNLNIKIKTNYNSLIKELIRILTVEIKKITFLSIIGLSSSIISIIPILSVLSFIINCFILAYYFLDYSLEVNLYTFKERLVFIKNNFIYIACFGLSLSLILFIPILNFVFIIYSVAGAAVLYKNLETNC